MPLSPGLRTLLAAVELLGQERVEANSDTARLAGLRALWPAVCGLLGEIASRVGEIHTSGAACADGFASTTAFLKRRLRLDPTTAARLIRVGTQLWRLPSAVCGLEQGILSVEHAAALVDVANDLGEKVMADGAVEQVLLDYALSHTPAEVRRLGRLIKLHILDDESAEERQIRLYEGRWLTVTTTFDGMVHLESMLDPVAGANLLAALAAYMPGPDPDGQRSARQRRADALHDIIGRALANPDRADTGEEKPNVAVTVSYETLANGLANEAGQARPPGQHRERRHRQHHDDEHLSAPDSGRASPAQASPGPASPAHADPSPASPGRAEPDEAVPSRADPGEADRRRDNLRTDNLHETNPGETNPGSFLMGHFRPGGPGLLSHGHEPIGAETARRLACDAKIIPVVLGSRSEPLDIGRASRTVPTGLRRAVDLRDGHCRFPGCDRPSKWCECHHVRFWARDGATKLDNIVLICRYHHVRVHEYGWGLSFDPATGIVSVTRPDGTPHDLVSVRDGPAP